jgi:hypothetical protein
MKRIYLQGKSGMGKFAIVDDSEYESISNYKWYIIRSGNNYYATRSIYRGYSEGHI